MIKTKFAPLFVIMVLIATVRQTAAQMPVISSFSQNGLLICTNLSHSSIASVEWASSLSGPWNTNWTGLEAVTVDANATIRVSVPMFYRVRGVAYQSITTTPDGMTLITAGSFTMGDTLNDGGIGSVSPTNVTVSAFYMDTNLVSYSRWQTTYAWAISKGYSFDNAGMGKGANYPVYHLNWYDAVKWSNARSQQMGLIPIYFTNPAFTAIYTNGDVDVVYANWAANGYRLPTEAEWEKAARGGLDGQRFPLGNTISESQANYYGAPQDYSYDLGPQGYNPIGSIGGVSPAMSPVGSFAPNGYGLYDMAGNVDEWCWDWYAQAPYPPGSPYLGGGDPQGPIGPYNNRVIRGGAWVEEANYVRCAIRNISQPSSTGYSQCGFRCVRKP